MKASHCVFVLVLGCGGNKADPPISSTTPPTATTQDPATPVPAPTFKGTQAGGVYGGTTYGGARFDTTPELKAFYDLIAPLSGPATDQRRAAACAAAPKLLAAAKAISSAPAPAGAHQVYDGEADELESIADDLGPNCAGADPATIDFDIGSLHRSYQRLLKMLPAYTGKRF